MSLREAARRWKLDLRTVRRWVDRAQGQRLDRVDFDARSHRPRKTTRTSTADEDRVLAIRTRLRDHSVLGDYGADAIVLELATMPDAPKLSRSTISRILLRRGAVEKRRRVRRRSPPPGWYLPLVARGEAELDSFDHIEDLVIQGGVRFDVLTGISLAGGIPAAFLQDRRSAERTVNDLLTHWRRQGLPGYAQFDNGTVFLGNRRHRDAIGRVVRLCLSLGVIPVFAPPREHGVQNLIEGFNSLWLRKVWRRRTWTSRDELGTRSDLYIDALFERRAQRRDNAPPRRPFPSDWKLDLNAPLQGSMILLRRGSEQGTIDVLGNRFDVAPEWSHRLTRAEVDFDTHEVRIYGLSRRQPDVQPLLCTIPHTVAQKPFRG